MQQLTKPELSKLIKSRRLELGISQLKLARMLGYTDPYFVSNIENGRSKFPLKKIKKLRRILFLDTKVLLNVLMTDERERIFKLLGIR